MVEVDDRLSNMLSFDEIRTIYDRWSEGDENRLRRDDRRWKFWKWNLRVCTPIGDGYVCHEGQQIRELVIENRDSNLALPANSEWIGLRSMAMRLGLVMENPQLEMYLLGRGISHAPQMFLTDQF